MQLDLRECPPHQSFAEYFSEKTGIYTRVANYVKRKDETFFRIITDPMLTDSQIHKLMDLEIRDNHDAYLFNWLEPIVSSVVDDVPHKNSTTMYMRLTFKVV